jgi:hypothetical protein
MGTNTCTINGRYLDYEVCMKLVKHDERKKIMRKLFVATCDAPITKKELSKKMGMDYNQLVYQLNHHLRRFWEIKTTKKVRGALSEYISPIHNNTVYVSMGQNAVIWVIDPMANLFGELMNTGTRCRQCSSAQIRSCLAEERVNCFCTRKSVDSRKQRNLLETNCKKPYTPIDYLITCTIISELEKVECTMEFRKNTCNPVNNLK